MKHALVVVLAIVTSGSVWPQTNVGFNDLPEGVLRGEAKDVQRLLAAGAKVNAFGSNGKTALIEAAERGRSDIVLILVAAGADLNLSHRGVGTALEAAERGGHRELAQLLRDAGARTSGRSIGDTVCVRPWKGDGFCGVVEAIESAEYRLRITDVVGCPDGCPARVDCSAGEPVGGRQGLKVGNRVQVANSCFTHTAVRP